jgi:polynucleotide 5'-hydroxyl-kinase GRC3/NOL9
MAPHTPQRSGRPGEAGTPLDLALEAASQARVTLILGTSDTGKTSLTARLASALAARGERVAVVDADVGQSEIGPPTTVGLGRVTGTLSRLADAEVLALEFVGDTSPVRYIRETADATGRLVRRALEAGFDRVLVDTGGLVEGPLGLALKRAKVRAADPDLVLVLQRRDESEPIARAIEGGERPRVVRLAPSSAVVRRSATRRQPLASLAEGLLVGVLGFGGETLGIARVKAYDAASQEIIVETPVARDRIKGLVAGRVTVGG